MSDSFDGNNGFFGEEQNHEAPSEDNNSEFNFGGFDGDGNADNAAVENDDSNQVEAKSAGVVDNGFIGAAFAIAGERIKDARGADDVVRKTLSLPLSAWKKIRIAEINNIGTGVTAHHLVYDAVVAAVEAGDLPSGETKKKKRNKDGVDSHNIALRAPAWWWSSLEVLAIGIGGDITPVDIIAYSVKNHTPKI